MDDAIPSKLKLAAQKRTAAQPVPAQADAPLLPRINGPEDLKRLTVPQLAQLADEVRAYILEVVSRTGGHLAPSLGVVELTAALHYVFDSPTDKIVWDVG